MSLIEYFNYTVDSESRLVPGVQITVRRAINGELATIYSDEDGTALSNPFTSDNNGSFHFFAKSDKYDIALSGYGGLTAVLYEEVVFDSMTEFAADTRTQFIEGSLVRVKKENMLYEVAAADATDYHEATAGGALFYESGTQFTTLDRFRAAVARGAAYKIGQTVCAEGIFYLKQDNALAEIAGLVGWTALIDIGSDVFALSNWKERQEEPLHALYKIEVGGKWFSPDPVFMVGLGQSNEQGNANANNGDKTGSGDVWVWNGVSWVVATLGQAPFTVGGVTPNNKLFHAAHRYSVKKGVPVFMFLEAVPGTSIGEWVLEDPDEYPGIWTTAIKGWCWLEADKAIKAGFAHNSLSMYPASVRKISAVSWAQGEGEYNLTPMHTLSRVQYPGLAYQIRNASWAAQGIKTVMTELLRQDAGGTAYRANEEIRKFVASGQASGFYLLSTKNSVTTGADTGQIVHFSGASLQEQGYDLADILLGESAGISSDGMLRAADATGQRIWKERAFTRLVDLSFDPTSTSAQSIVVINIINGNVALFEVDGVVQEVVAANSRASLTLQKADPSFVRIWVATDEMRDFAPGLSVASTGSDGKLRSFVLNPIAAMSQVYLAGHPALRHNVVPALWPREMSTFRLDNCQLVSFEDFVAEDLPTGISLMSFTGLTPVSRAVRAAIEAERVSRASPFTVNFGPVYNLVGDSYPEDFNVPVDGVSDGEAKFIQFAAQGGSLRASPGSVVRAATRTGSVVFPAGTFAQLANLKFLQEYTENGDGAIFQVLAGTTVEDLAWHIGSSGGVPCWFQRGMIVEARAKLKNWVITADAPFPAGAVTDVRDGVISLRGPRIVVEDCEFHGHQKPISAYRGNDYSDGVIRNCHVYDMISFISLNNSGFDRGLIDGVYVYSTHPLASPDPGHNVVTGGAPYAVVRNIYQMFDGMGTGEHFIYSAVDDGTLGMSFEHIYARGSGQCFMKWRGHDGLRGTHLHGGPTSLGNSPGTNEDGFRLENCRNWMLSDISMRLNPQFTEPAGYDSIHLKNTWNGLIRKAYFEKPRRCYIAISTPAADPDYTNPPNDAVTDIVIEDFVAVGAENNRPLILGVTEDTGTVARVGNITIKDLDWDGDISRLVEADVGITIQQIAGTRILIEGKVRGKQIRYEWVAGSSPVITYQNATDLVETVANLEALSVPAGQKGFATDANSSSFGAVVDGGGANFVPVFFDGTDWRVG